MRSTLGQLIRYGVVGVLSNAIGFVLYLAITAAGVPPLIAMSLLYALGVAQTFVFNKRWSFRYQGSGRTTFIRYCAAYAVGYMLSLVTMHVLVNLLGLPHQLVQGALIFAVAGVLFLLQKFWVFRDEHTSPTAHPSHS